MPLSPRRLLLPLMLLLGFWVLTAPGYAQEEEPKGEASAYRQIELFTDVLSILRKSYVEEVDLNELVQGALKGMMATLDPHSAFMSPDVYREMKIDTEGEFGGLGIEITLRDGVLTIVAPIEDTPADRAGLEAGDVIVHIEGEPTKELSIMEAVKLMRGPVGKELRIGVMREGFERPRDFTLVREIIQIKSVKARMLDEAIAYIRLAQFQSHTVEELRSALDRLHEQSDGDLRGLVLDLRNNPGGLLEQAVAVADLFLDQGLIVYTQGREEGSRMSFSATAPSTEPNYPMVVLINEGSASASEIVAGALRDHDRALILGTRSFGKGSVQTIIPLSDDSGLRLTTARYFTPNGTSIQARGIAPDIVVPRMEMKEIAVPVGHVREKDLEGHFEGKEPLAEEEPQKKEGDSLRKDYPLVRALDLLKGWHFFRTKEAASGE